jgi:3-oxoacyl-[acyl-carrier-protein] synthase-3
MYSNFEGIEIIGLASSVPEPQVDNRFFEHLLNEKEMRMFEKTVGIKERRWASVNVTASDLGYHAANDLILKLGISRSDIGALIFLSQTSDYIIPFTSNILQHRLNLSKSMMCLDINAGCAGFIQGLYTAFSMVDSLPDGKIVLLIVAETLSKIISKNDKSTSMLFGDGASAILVGKSKSAADTCFNFFSDGSKYDSIIIPDGGFRNWITQQSFEAQKNEKNNMKTPLNLHMNGQAVFDFTLREVAVGINSLISETRTSINEIDFFILHQSNNYIINQIAAQLEVPKQKMLVNIQSFGNTSGVSIPLVISDYHNVVRNANKIILSGYGSGLNWGNCLINLSRTNIFPITSI